MKTLVELEKKINSELTTKIKNSSIKNGELLINSEVINLNSILMFLKSIRRINYWKILAKRNFTFLHLLK